MDSFPANIKFKYPWRPYQERVLKEVEKYFNDDHLHIIAAPGSGKTILGLEVARLLNKPVLILSPTLTIRDQWVERFVTQFLPSAETPDWISSDIKNPAFFTVSTYQGLWSAYTGSAGEKEESGDVEIDEEDLETSLSSSESERSSAGKKTDVGSMLNKMGIKTVIVDEAHHMTNEWWKALTDVIGKLDNPKIVALTATPPYDVSPAEWERYKELCGPVDAEISVPELVKVSNLCPHQDHIYFSFPAEEEQKKIDDFKVKAAAFTEKIYSQADLVEAVAAHSYLTDAQKYSQEILANADYAISMAVFLKKSGKGDLSGLMKVLALNENNLPEADILLLEMFLSFCLYQDEVNFKEHQKAFAKVKDELEGMGAVEKRKVMLSDNSKLKKILTSSLTKLDSIVNIVRIESIAMKDALRMVILTDYIRKASLPDDEKDIKTLDRIGVVPIFEKLRRSKMPDIKLGILSGGIVVIPGEAEKLLYKIAEEDGVKRSEFNLKPLSYDKSYLELNIKGGNKKLIVRLMTKLFTQGGISVMVGTKSLLGEGWDAPSINTLILASFVGSFMLSNQMRGRAIRVQPGNPDKAANIWSLVCVEENSPGSGDDLATLSRRFRAFVGVSFKSDSIVNGIHRLDIGKPPYTKEMIASINDKMKASALDRRGLIEKWKAALKGEGKLIDGIVIPKFPFVGLKDLAASILVLIAEAACMLGSFILRKNVQEVYGTLVLYISRIQKLTQKGIALTPKNMPKLVINDQALLLFLVGTICIIAAICLLPWAVTRLMFLFRHRSFISSMRQIGKALLKAFRVLGIFKTKSALNIAAENNPEFGGTFVYLKGGTYYESAMLLDSLEEIVGPIGDTRYILSADPGIWKHSYAVPAIIGKNKEWAGYFKRSWRQNVVKMGLFYTKAGEGMQIAAAARTNAIHPQPERLICWK